jgi:hypothetical protein
MVWPSSGKVHVHLARRRNRLVTLTKFHARREAKYNLSLTLVLKLKTEAVAAQKRFVTPYQTARTYNA